MSLRTLSPGQETGIAVAKTLHDALARIDISAIPVLSRDRYIARKEQAKLTRGLLKDLGLKGISVTTPNYSMASIVRVRLPKRHDHVMEDGYVVDGDETAQANSDASARVGSILFSAFPQHDDRSDSQTDYYDSCWSIH